MLDIQKTNIAKLVNVLDVVEASYKIILPDGTEYGTLETKPVKVKKARSKASPYPRGELKAYVEGFISSLKPGEATEVPFGSYPGTLLATSCCSTAHALWGKQNSSCKRRDDRQAVQVMRYK